MDIFLFLFLLFLTGCSEDGICKNGIMVGNVVVNGETLYVAEYNGNKGDVSISDNSIMVQHGPRFYFASECKTSFSPYMFKSFPVLGGWFSFKVDLSKVGCGCNAAVYFTAMPGFNKTNLPDPTSCGDYYCDANAVCGELCPEMDLMEANSHAFQIAPHSCGLSLVGKHYYWCDNIGCFRKSHDLNPQAYGPGDQYIINSNHPFQMNFSFIEAGNKLSEIRTVVTGYNGKTFIVNPMTDPTCHQPTKISDMTDSLRKGMVLVVSSWGKTMSWLDVPPCDPSTTCNNGPFILSDISYG